MDSTNGGITGNRSLSSSPPRDDGVPAISGLSPWRLLRILWFPTLALAGLLIVTACSPAEQTSEPIIPAGQWREFQGTWTATGNRHMIGLGHDRRASVASFSGTLLLSGPSRPGIGFRAEAIVFNDTVTGMVGRAVWTDERGDQAYSELHGEGTATGNRIVGTFLGGTGRYSGATGSYEFSWRFVLESEDGSVQGQSVSLNGRVRVDRSQGISSGGGPQS